MLHARICSIIRKSGKNIEELKKEGQQITYIENWGNIYKSKSGNWRDEKAKEKHDKMVAELIEKKNELAESAPEGTPLEEIIVPIEDQLEILGRGVGVAKGTTIRGVGYGPRRETTSHMHTTSIASAAARDEKIEELTGKVKELTSYIMQMKDELAAIRGSQQNNSHGVFGNDVGENDDTFDDLEYIRST